MHVSTVFAVQTQGRGDMDHWIESFRLEYSQDCVSFNSMLNVNGNNHVRNILIYLNYIHYAIIKVQKHY